VGAVRVGLPMQVGKFYFEPRFTGTYSNNQEEGFTESRGAFPFNLRYGERTTNYWFTDLGFKLALPMRTKQRGALVTPNLLVSWMGNWDQGNPAQRYYVPFSTRNRARGTFFARSGAETEHALMLEGGLDYTVRNINATSFLLYARGGTLIWDDATKPADWRASGGFTFQF
ncbi:MAG: autotransporter outer membrane beta-barrel domain-containing protein, partial [Synechococcus sp.]